MSELKCPFCQQELEIGGVDGILRGCPKCRNLGTEMLWQELICTKKQLETTDLALDQLNLEKYDIEDELDRTRKTLEQITALKQKD